MPGDILPEGVGEGRRHDAQQVYAIAQLATDGRQARAVQCLRQYRREEEQQESTAGQNDGSGARDADMIAAVQSRQYKEQA